MRNAAVALAMFSFCTLGCNFIKSTPLVRFDDNSFAGQSNGALKEHNQPRPFRGVPVALKVPTHVDVEITETYFLYMQGSPNGERILREVVFDDPKIPRNLNVSITPILTKKLFTVDFVRPAAGTLNYKATFNDEQYFSGIENTIVDETVKDITAAIKTVAPSLGFKSTSEVGTNVAGKVSTATRTVAFARFDIDAPDFEEQLNSFLDLHVSGCHNCQGRTKPGAPEPAEVLPSPARHATREGKPIPGGTSVTRRPRDPNQPVLKTSDYVVYPHSN